MEISFNLSSLVVPIISAVIAAGVSSYVAKKNIQQKFVESLYEKRYETYTKLLQITQQIGKDRKAVKLNQMAREELIEWQSKTGGYLLLSKNAHSEFNKLKNALKSNPEKKNEYSELQRKKIWEARNGLRGALRDDFEFFHSSEKDL